MKTLIAGLAMWCGLSGVSFACLDHEGGVFQSHDGLVYAAPPPRYDPFAQMRTQKSAPPPAPAQTPGASPAPKTADAQSGQACSSTPAPGACAPSSRPGANTQTSNVAR